ncbi:MFS transporter [Lactiplantibacillus fabifermentans]|uniref:Permease n=2 Tax=Lactiplantibacillus fabifermentans TaxID=483011 RepID=A0A0R2NFT8_9LACO|nr:MFS transporter [Lactiplantibacillus fabifermentans]ETY75476.1 transporter [Lactiplantibacillus fabifermentans T30PCM01]KRO24687.1 permease [Lactiplantibacillus fabifermentans DSM 21115]
MKNKYLPTSISLYLNYLIVGMSIIILPQNMDALASQWHTTLAGVAIVISAVGLGRMFISLISGVLSDRFGRQLMIRLGTILTIIFFAGALLSRSLYLAIGFAVLGGIGGAALDSGTYPALMEMFPQHQSIANVVLKAFVAIGQFILPLLISVMVLNRLWYGWSFVLALVILALNIFCLFRFAKFPDDQPATAKKAVTATTPMQHPGNLWIDGVLFAIFGYTADGIFLLVSIWITKYGQTVVQMNDTQARSLVSYYSAGSIICVLVTIWLSHRGVQDIQFLMAYMLTSLVALTILYLFPTPLISTIMAFVVGFSAAGGVMQIALTIMASFFPNGKGTITGLVTTASSVASFTVNVFAGMMANNIANIILFDVGLAAIGFVATILITMRYHYIFGKPSQQLVAKP